MSAWSQDLDPDPEPNSVVLQTTPEGITTIILSRPHKRNAVDPPTARKLTEAFIAFENDAAQKVAVFRGANDTFCAGFDLKALADSNLSSPSYDSGTTTAIAAARRPLPVGGDGRKNIGPMGPSRMQIAKPVICAVSGYAVAGGLELSLLGDMRVVEEDAVFGVFCRRWGVPLIDGGTVRLQKIIGLGRAMDMILTGRPVGAQEALNWGLANRVVPKGKSYEEAMVLARQLIGFPQGCMNLDRESAYYTAYKATSFEDALKFEFDNSIGIVDAEGVKGAERFRSGVGRHGVFEVGTGEKL